MRNSTEVAECPTNRAGTKQEARWLHTLSKLGVLGCALLLSLSAGELLIRRYYPIGDYIWQLDKRYLHRHIPNSRRVYRFSAANGGNRVLVTINSEGRRGSLVSMSRPRILVYGDSFISATFAPIRQTFVWQLEQRLKAPAAPAPQVVNCGVSGYGPDQESLVLEDEIDNLRPKLVIVSIYTGNDFGDLLRDKIYRLDDHDQLQANSYTIDPSLVSQFASLEHLPRLYTIRLLQKAWEHLAASHKDTRPSASVDYLHDWLRDSQAEYQEYVVEGNNSVRNLFEDHYDADVSLTPRSESARYKRTLMERVIERLKQITSTRSIPLMLLIIPSPIDVVDKYSVSVDARRYPEYRRSELTDVVEDIARKHQIPYVNLFKPFQEHDARSLYYVIDNDHWNEKGQELAASLTAEYITQYHLLDSAASVAAWTRK